MPDLGVLNILIAMIIVILVLSLVVQSIQTLIKKALKLKSRSLLNSLEDLFETITQKPAATTASPNPATAATVPGTSRTPKELVADVTRTLKDMGRRSIFGTPMLDSLAKGDLLKVLTRVKAEDLLPGAVSNFGAVLSGIKTLKAELDKIKTNLLKGEASARFAAMQGSIMPIIHDLEALAAGGKIDPAVFFGDLFKLRQIKAAEVLTLLGQVQQTVSQDLSAAQTASAESRKALAAAEQSKNEDQINSAKVLDAQANGDLTALKEVDAGLKNIASEIAALSEAFDAALAPLFARLEQVEVWYDTVMQGFEERYTRHMRSVGLAISIAVVVILNANFFAIYTAIKSDPKRTNDLVEQVEKNPNILKRQAQNQGTRPNGANAAATPAPDPSASPATASSPTVSPSPGDKPVTVADLRAQANETKELVGTYESLGIKPLSRAQISNAFHGQYRWRDLSETLLGWIIMIMLLSAGAPFWQDTLESLFGLKNLLRQKSGTRNVEEEKGGQTKP